jgi:type VI secretion system protein VasJ
MWLKDRLASSLQAREKLSASDDLILELETAAQDFASRVNEALQDQAPAFVELLQAVGSRAADVRSRQAAAERSRDEASRRAAGLESGEIADPADAEKVLDSCRERLWRVAGFLFRTDPANPASYRITRSTTWGWLVELPANEKGTTYLPACPVEAVKQCEACAAAGDWTAVVRESESGFTERIFGFDLQRHLLQAMSRLGEPFAAARLAVATELAGLLRRLPGLPDLRFADGTPLADAATKAWITDEILAAGPGAAPRDARTDAAAGKDGMDLEAAIAEARRLQGSGNLQKAVGLFKEGVARASKRRQRFLWRLALAKLCLEAGKPQLALPQLVSLDEDIGRFCLEEWEPDLSLEVVHHLFLCRQRLAAGLPERTSDVEHQLQELYQRLCRLDVNAALAVEY